MAMISTSTGNSLRSWLSDTAAAINPKIYPSLIGTGLTAALLSGAPSTAFGMNLYDGSNAGNNLEINLTTDLSYSVFYRVNDPSAILAGPGNANGSEGDLNFRHGIVSNELQALPVLDIRDGDYGAHVSGEFYLNTVYLQKNKNDQPATLNPFSVAEHNDFTSATRNINGQNARLLDAFVYGGHQFSNGQIASLKIGRQTLLWGQSLLFTNDGIAAGQAPIDILTGQSLPNPQAQQVFLPVGQVVATYQPTSSLTLQAYYQFEYEHDVFQGVGAYFNSADILDKGGQRAIVGSGLYFTRIKDKLPPIENGQFGASVQDNFDNVDFGLYALRYDAKAPELYAIPGPGSIGFLTPTKGGVVVGNYQFVYPRDIQIYGASFSTTAGPANIAGEISGRRNMPLVGGFTQVLPGTPPTSGAGGNSAAAYPVGSTVAAQASLLYVSPGVPLDPGGVSVTAEAELNHVLSVDKNKSELAPGRQATAGALEVIFEPTYYNPIPNLTLGIPIGITYNFLGRSEMDQTIQHGTGNVTFGLSATYLVTWIATLTYKDYFGKPDVTYNGLADRGYVSLNLQHSF